MSHTVSIGINELKILHSVARQAGTLEAWAELCLQYAESAENRISELEKEARQKNSTIRALQNRLDVLETHKEPPQDMQG